MSDTTLSPEDLLKQTNLKDDEGKSHENRTDSIEIHIPDAEQDGTKYIEEKTNSTEKLAESTNQHGSDESICIEIPKCNEGFEKVLNNEGGKDYMVYGTQVFFQGGFDRHAHIEPSGAPLDYEPQSRNSFVKLVFIIVFVMILCTAGFTSFVLMSPDVKSMFIRNGLFIAIPAMVIMMGLSYAMSCSPCTRVFPCNMICLILAVLAMSLITGYITSRYDTELILYALIATTVTVFVCICLACTNFDFTQWMLYVIAISVAFSVIAGIIMLTMLLMNTYWSLVHLVILIVGTLLNVVILIMELQTILGGKAVELGEEDYALGAFFLYTAIIDIFLKLVQIFGIIDKF